MRMPHDLSIARQQIANTANKSRETNNKAAGEWLGRTIVALTSGCYGKILTSSPTPVLPHLAGLSTAAIIDTAIGTFFEESLTKDGARLVLGTAVTALFVPTITEAALFYLGYRTAYTCMRAFLCGLDRRKTTHA